MDNLLKPRIRFKGFTDVWEQRKFENIFNYERPDKYIVNSTEYLEFGPTPVLTANKAFILGYTVEKNKYVNSHESIIFDDFTLDTKFVDFPYMVKSSAIKILTLKDEKKDNIRFNFELLSNHRFNMLGHARHYISVVQPEEVFTTNKQEQNKIGDLFTNLDNLITLHQRKCDKLVELKKSLLEKMFPKNSSNIPEIRFKGFTDVWEQRKFGDYGTVSMCKRIFKNETSDSGDIPFYKIGTFGGKADAFISNEKYDYYKSKFSYPNKGDILLSASGTIGRIVEYTGEKAYFQDSNIVWLNHNEDIKNVFLKVLYPTVKWDGIEGSTIKRLYNSNFLNTYINIPNTLEQEKIGDLFTNLDNLITLHQRKHEKLVNLKQSLLNDMFI